MEAIDCVGLGKHFQKQDEFGTSLDLARKATHKFATELLNDAELSKRPVKRQN
jgi:hypothetical protein